MKTISIILLSILASGCSSIQQASDDYVNNYKYKAKTTSAETTTIHHKGYKGIPSKTTIYDPKPDGGCRTITVRGHDKKGKPKTIKKRVCS